MLLAANANSCFTQRQTVCTLSLYCIVVYGSVVIQLLLHEFRSFRIHLLYYEYVCMYVYALYWFNLVYCFNVIIFNHVFDNIYIYVYHLLINYCEQLQLFKLCCCT